MTRKGHEGGFGDVGNVLYSHLGGDYMMYKLKFIDLLFRLFVFTVNTSYLNKNNKNCKVLLNLIVQIFTRTQYQRSKLPAFS